MSIRSVSSSTLERNGVDGINRLIYEMKVVGRRIQELEVQLNQVINNTTIIQGSSTNLEDYMKLAVWDKIAGNSIQYNYYNGVVPNNPSGNDKNVSSIVYLTGATPIITTTFVYDAQDRVISATTV